jgi:Tat protein translocase TatC
VAESPSPPPSRGEMPFLDHLEELRWRILYSLLAVVVGTLIGWWIVQHFDVIGLLMRPIAPLLPSGRLMFTSPTDPFFITLKLAFAVGLVVVSPVVIYQIWAFLAPALYEREKRLIVPSLSVGVVLFAAGAAVAYLWILPRALTVLLSLQRQELSPIITADKYFGVAAPFIIGFGVVAELPLVVTILAALGLVTPRFLIKNRRYAVVLIAIVAALLTPPDAVSMLLMLGPLLLLYEISIFCAWIATRRRARREAAAAAARTALVVLLVAALAGAGAGSLQAQGRPVTRQPGARADTSGRPVAGKPGAGQAIDTGTARRLGLPTGPTRALPPPDSVADSLLKLSGYRVTQYVADTLVVIGDSQAIYLRGNAYLEREGTKLEADSVRYREASCRLDAAGDPRLFDQSTVLVGEGMRYDTCVKRGTVTDALTSFQQGGATWFLRGDLAVDSGSTRLYGAKSAITSSDLPVPDYHFATGEVKWLNKSVMIARPAVLYVRDVPIVWMPFIFQDIRPGRRSGFLVPRFGLNDLVRPTRRYQRHISNLGYYWVFNDYVDVLGTVDWFAGHNMSVNGVSHYRWLDRFVTGSVSYTRLEQLDGSATSTRFGWQHNQAFDSRTRFSASIDYATSASVVQRNTVDPYLATAQLTSSANFDKRFSWGTFNLGGSRSQNLSNALVTQNFPRVTLTPAPINIGEAITWSPAFSYNNSQTFHNPLAPLLVPGASGVPDTSHGFFDNRQTDLSFGTPVRIGRWNWSNQLTLSDHADNQRTELALPDPNDPTRIRRVLYGREFETRVDWSTGINLPQALSGTWKLQPQVQILNQTSAGPFAIRNQFTGGQWVHQGKRLAFGASLAPTFFGFFPGVGPVTRFRHAVQLLIGYQYAPAARVSDDFARAIDPAGANFRSRSDPQQTITVSLSQTFEAKLRPPPGDTTGERQARKIRLLSVSTSGVSYNFEQAKRPGFTGWQTQTITNSLASELIPFSLTITHDLWRGVAGTDSAKFDPFLQSVSLSGFTITGGTLRSIGALLGLAGGGRAPPPGGAGPSPEGQPPPPTPGVPGFLGGAPRGVNRVLPAAGGGFTLQVATLSISRTRGSPTRTEQTGLSMAFSPTPNWALSWNTSYDFVTRQFANHYVRLERNLHRWHASFSFTKTASGNFAFNFYISLMDEPDVKFDYDQQSFRR